MSPLAYCRHRCYKDVTTTTNGTTTVTIGHNVRTGLQIMIRELTA